MARKLAYGPVVGPQQRRKLLRELARRPPRKKWGVSPREIRRTTGKMFGFTPLTPITQAEYSFLKNFAEKVTRYATTRMAQKANDFRSGRLLIKKRKGRGLENRRARRSELPNFFSNARKYSRPNILDTAGSISSLGPIVINGSRSLEGYLTESNIDVLKLARKKFRENNRPIRLLDIGSATARMLKELKTKLKENVETHALTPEDEPHYETDFYHHLMAEYLPATFNQKFDIVVSNRALEYALLPNLALKNISHALAPNGTAQIQWRAGRTQHITPDDPQTNAFFSTYSEAKPTQGTVQLIQEVLELQRERTSDTNPITPQQARQKIREAIQQYKWDARQTIAWCNEIVRLQQNSEYAVQINSWTMTSLGYVPGNLTIHKK